MNRQEGYEEIHDYLNKCVMAAKMYGDDEMRLRCGRALFAFEADTSIEIFDCFVKLGITIIINKIRMIIKSI